MEMSTSIANLSEALSKFQGEITDPVKNSTAKGAYTFKYAGLDVVVKAVRPIAAKYGLGFMQYPVNHEPYIDAKGISHASVGVVTMIVHSSGEWIKSDPFVVPAMKQDAQGYGSCITYAKRYSLAAALGVSADEDDDSNIGCNNPVEITHKQQNKPVQSKPAQSKPAQTKPMNPTTIPGVHKGANDTELLQAAKQQLADRASELGVNLNDVFAELQKRFNKKTGYTVAEYTSVYNDLPSMVKAG